MIDSTQYPKQPFVHGCLVKQPFFTKWFGIIQLKQLKEAGGLEFQDDIFLMRTPKILEMIQFDKLFFDIGGTSIKFLGNNPTLRTY